jgi:hypothetical protein
VCSSVFFIPSATSMIPATIGRCRYAYESRAIEFCSRPGAAFESRRSATSATTSK